MVSWLNPASKLKRQRGQDHVVRSVAEVVADALGPCDEVSVAEHDSLRLTGAAGRVHDGGHVRIDGTGGEHGPATGGKRPGTHRVLALPAQIRGGSRAVPHEHYVLDGLALLEFLAEQGEPLRRGHQDPHIAVLKDVTDLPGPQQRVDRDKDPAACRHAEQRGDRLDSLVEIDGNPVTAAKPQGAQRGAEVSHLTPELRVGDGDVLEGQSGCVPTRSGRLRHEMVDLTAHSHHVLLLLSAGKRAGGYQRGTHTSSL